MGPTHRITAVERTRRGRFSIFADGEFLFSVDAETLAKSGLAEGDELSEAEIEDLRGNSDTRRAKDKALTFLSLRAYGSAELYDKLCRSFDEHTAAAAVAEMTRLDLLDDAEFARRRAAYLHGQRKSLWEIRQKLLALGLTLFRSGEPGKEPAAGRGRGHPRGDRKAIPVQACAGRD